ncbi:MAG: hypothetical protein OEV42_11585 [Deltaproteobacteria bacterium]|nr:hypothetical protein [Deltaproteobacteria bacterium]
MEFNIRGGSWINGEGFGILSEIGANKSIALTHSDPIIPGAKELFHEPLQRYGRFDTFTKLGCAAAALALADADRGKAANGETWGMVIASDYEVMATDLEYYETTEEEGGAFSSPNLFSYTLPVITLGECAVYYKLTGPTFCVGDNGLRGLNALKCAASMMAQGKATSMIAGWLDAPPPLPERGQPQKGHAGALFIVLDLSDEKIISLERKLHYKNNTFYNYQGNELKSLLDLFSSKEN